jgi:hypothetical protein
MVPRPTIPFGRRKKCFSSGKSFVFYMFKIITDINYFKMLSNIIILVITPIHIWNQWETETLTSVSITDQLIIRYSAFVKYTTAEFHSA